MTNEAIKTINASDIKPDDEWMQENEWDAIYAKEMTKEDFKKFAKEQFGYDISFEKSDEPDTYESLFGSCKGCEHAPTTYEEYCSHTCYPDAYTNKAEVLDKIKAEIDRQEKWLMDAGYNAYNVDIAFNSIRSVVKESEE